MSCDLAHASTPLSSLRCLSKHTRRTGYWLPTPPRALLHWTASFRISTDASVRPGVENPCHACSSWSTTICRNRGPSVSSESVPPQSVRPGQHSCLRPWYCVCGPLCQCIVASLALPDSVCLDPSFCDHCWLAVIALGADCLTASHGLAKGVVPDVDQVDTKVFCPRVAEVLETLAWCTRSRPVTALRQQFGWSSSASAARQIQSLVVAHWIPASPSCNAEFLVRR